MGYTSLGDRLSPCRSQSFSHLSLTVEKKRAPTILSEAHPVAIEQKFAWRCEHEAVTPIKPLRSRAAGPPGLGVTGDQDWAGRSRWRHTASTSNAPLRNGPCPAGPGYTVLEPSNRWFPPPRVDSDLCPSGNRASSPELPKSIDVAFLTHRVRARPPSGYFRRT